MVNKDPLKVMMFVCSGNTCRSPMAEGFMNHFLKIHGLDGIWGASSSGTMAIDGLPANGLAVRVMSENGIDISRHRSKPAGSWEPPEDSLFLGMTRDHVNCLRNLFPRRRGRSVYLARPPVRSTRGTYSKFQTPLEAAWPVTGRLPGSSVR